MIADFAVDTPPMLRPVVFDRSVTLDDEAEKAYTRLKAAEAARDRLAAEKADARAPIPAPVTLGDFLAVPDEDAAYVVDSLMPVGGNVLLVAAYKAGKSTLVSNLIRSLADGDDFLGKFPVADGKRVTLIDDELDERTLRRWLREQGVVNVDRVSVLSLRGRVSTFNLPDPTARDEWAAALSGTDVLIFDCLRPALDALGLDENLEAGQFLVAFDELKKAAGIDEAVIVHHSGHGEETRARGSSRILDWPDAVWNLERQDKADLASPRFLSAFGRDVQLGQGRLDYDETTRRLTFHGGSKKASQLDTDLGKIVDQLGVMTHGWNGSQFEAHFKGVMAQARVREALKHGVATNALTVVTGIGRNAKEYRLPGKGYAS